MTASIWKDPSVVHHYLEEVRGAIPYGAAQLQLMIQLTDHFRPDPERILDLGCGDGILARTLLDRYPGARAVLLDHSPPMIEHARKAMAPFAGRGQVLLADLAEPLESHTGAATFDLVVSGFAIHHLPHPRKRSLYEEIYAALAPGGLFLNSEHVAPSTPALEALFESLFIDHMAGWSQKPREQVEQEFYQRPDQNDNILERVETQVEWLRQIGFHHADCYFKWLELALFGGLKPA